MKYVIGIDVGTSGVKTVLFSQDGSLCGSETGEYPLYQPQNGWAEQDPADWWKQTALSIRRLLEKTCVRRGEIEGVGLTGQMHGLIMLDENGGVLRSAIIWCDQRSGAQCDKMTRDLTRDRLIEFTANPALTGFTAAKLLWVKENEPDIYAKCRHILLPKDYIRYKLTGVFATDMSDASGMQLLDVKNRCWSKEMLDYFGLGEAMLAKLYESPEITGTVNEQAARETGLTAGTKVAAGAGDNAAAAVGTGVVCDGHAFTTIGTSGVVFAHTSAPKVDPKGRVHTFCCAVPGAWHVMGVTQAAGLSLKWFRDELCCELHAQAKADKQSIYRLMDDMAGKSPIGANRLLFLPYLMGERTPHLDPGCRGVFFGLSAMHTRADLIRAVLEGVGYSLLDCYEILKEMGVCPDDMTLCGGGANSPIWKQMLCDMFSCPVSTVRLNEGAAQGAAILAAVGCGLFQSVQDASDCFVKKEQDASPNLQSTERYRSFYQVYKSLYPALREEFHTLAAL